jgi:hypothetical protein
LPFTTRETVRRPSAVQNKPVEQSQLSEPSLFQGCDLLVVQGNDGKAGKFNGGCVDAKKRKRQEGFEKSIKGQPNKWSRWLGTCMHGA